MNTIKYSFNWNNKLFCIAWSTIRLYNEKKYKIGEIYNHVLVNKKDNPILTKPGKLLYYYFFSIKDMTEAIALLDTGYTKEEAIKMLKIMYKNKNINWENQKLSFMVFSSKI